MSTEELPTDVGKDKEREIFDPTGNLSYLTLCGFVLWCVEAIIFAVLVFF